MNKIILFEDGSWEWEELATVKLKSSGLKHIILTIGDGWHDSEVSKMISDYFHEENQSWIFNQ